MPQWMKRPNLASQNHFSVSSLVVFFLALPVIC